MDIEADLDMVMGEEEAKKRIALAEQAKKIEHLVVTMQATLNKVSDMSSPYTRTLEEDLHSFIMDGTLLKSKITAALETKMPDNDELDDEYNNIRSRWSELRTITSRLTSSRPSDDEPADRPLLVSDDDEFGDVE